MIDTAIYAVIGRERIADISTEGGVGLTTSQIPPTKSHVIYAQIQVQESDMRYTLDGTAPTTSLGFILAENGIIEVWGGQALRGFLCIDNTDNDALLEVIYYGQGG